MGSRRQLFLVVPGLRLPALVLRDLSFDLPLPGLRQLLAEASPEVAKLAELNPLIAAAISPESIQPAAPLRLLGLGGKPGMDRWLCLDPINLGIRERALLVNDPGNLALGMEEAQALVTDLRPLFAELGELSATTTQHWHLRLTAEAPDFPPLHQAIGGGADVGLTDDRRWRRLLNDAQILLHTHPVNSARQSAGLPVVNSLWPWGKGALADLASTPEHESLVMHTSDAVLQGLTFHHGQTLAPLPEKFTDLVAGDELMHVVHLNALKGIAGSGDAYSWRTALESLEADWFAPVHAASYDVITLLFPGTIDTRMIRLDTQSWLQRLKRALRRSQSDTDDLLAGKLGE